MAEFCVNCWNRINETENATGKYIISKEKNMCEGCGELKKVIISEKRNYHLSRLEIMLFPMRIIFFPVKITIRLICRLYMLARSRNRKI